MNEEPRDAQRPEDERVVENPGGSGEEVQLTELEEKVLEKLKTVFDPEIPVNIYDLGLIYTMKVDEEDAHVDIKMTLTAPGCPVAGTFPDTVRMTVEALPEIESCEVELVWYPPWNPDMMSEAAKLELGFF
jgi:FeS assembly SUF system protein